MAISPASYARGNPVYKAGSNAPTRGTVDPMGYINRSLNNPSQARSGLASAALNKLQSNTSIMPHNSAAFQQARAASVPGAGTPPVGMGHQVTATGTLIPIAPAVDHRTPGPGGLIAPGSNTTALTTPTPELTAGQGINEQQQSAGPPPQLLARQGAPDLGTNMPFDSVAGAAQQRLMAGRNNYLQQANQQRQDLADRYIQQQRDANAQHPEDLRHLINSFASRGMAYSSGYADNLGKTNDRFANLLAQFDQNHTRGLNGITTSENQYDSDYAAKLQELRAAATERLSRQAGDLGLGAPAMPDPVMPDPAPAMPEPSAPTYEPAPSYAPPAPAAPAMTAGHSWQGAVDAHSRATLAAGGTVTRGNGYVYKMSGPNGTGVPVRVA